MTTKKSSLICILRVLQEYSDDEHFMTQNEITQKVYDIYGLEIERKSVAAAIKTLIELGFDINNSGKGKKGVALYSRDFDQTQIAFLIDATFNSRGIGNKDAAKIIEILSKKVSNYQRKDYSYITKTEEVNRTDSKDVLFNLSVIHNAINENKKIKFNYRTYDENALPIYKFDGYIYRISPYYLVNNNSRYYLICHYRDKYDGISVFRLDYMENITIDDEDLIPLNELKDFTNGNFNIARYLNDNIYLFGGNATNVKVELKEPDAIKYVKDWFGEAATFQNENGKIVARFKCNENAIIYWALQYIQFVTILEPESAVTRIKRILEEGINKYDSL